MELSNSFRVYLNENAQYKSNDLYNLYNRELLKQQDKEKYENILKDYNSVTRNSIEQFAPLADNISGYFYGSKIGHPVIGLLTGKDGALGAASSYNDRISIDDVYSNGKLKNKMIGGALGGAGLGYAMSKINPERYTFTTGDTHKKLMDLYTDGDLKNDTNAEDIINNGDTMETLIPTLAVGGLTGAITLPVSSGIGYGVGKGFGKLTSSKKY